MREQAKQAVLCLECEAPLDVPDNCVIGEILPCGECGCEMEVVSLEPLTLELAPDIEEDWGE
jgi:alpha-aminoadipate carrier protein LysW